MEVVSIRTRFRLREEEKKNTPTVFTALRTEILVNDILLLFWFDAVNSVSYRFTIHYDGLKLNFVEAYLVPVMCSWANKKKNKYGRICEWKMGEKSAAMFPFH